MRILILGGTAWLGGTVAKTALAAGHEVACLARGSSVPNGVHLVQADRDNDASVAPVAGKPWDAVIDVARQPIHVTRAVRDLAAMAGRYVFVSTKMCTRPRPGWALTKTQSCWHRSVRRFWCPDSQESDNRRHQEQCRRRQCRPLETCVVQCPGRDGADEGNRDEAGHPADCVVHR